MNPFIDIESLARINSDLTNTVERLRAENVSLNNQIMVATSQREEFAGLLREARDDMAKAQKAIEASIRYEETAPGFGHAASKDVRGQTIEALVLVQNKIDEALGAGREGDK